MEPNGTTILFGGGTAKELNEDGATVYDETRRAPPGEPLPILLIRLSETNSVVDCLTKADANDLISINMGPPFGDTFFTDAAAPTEDGVELTAPLQELVRSSVPPGTELLGGANLDEGTEFMSSTPPLACDASELDFKNWAMELFGKSLGEQVPAKYTKIQQPIPACRGFVEPNHTTVNYMAAMRSSGDAAILCRTRDFLRTASSTGGSGFWYGLRTAAATSLFFCSCSVS